MFERTSHKYKVMKMQPTICSWNSCSCWKYKTGIGLVSTFGNQEARCFDAIVCIPFFGNV